jgi:ADP-dependent NAD(P)H-hydrate dehydratase / NAD(P)H-hydrate epimerase
MKHVVSTEEMRWCDEAAINTYSVSGLLLMENAGRGVVEVIKQEFSPLESKHILVICGKGNNGGDGFVVTRMLLNYCTHIIVLLMASPSELKGDAKTNFKILQKFAKKSSGQIIIQRYSKRLLAKLSQPDIIVDAMFGAGFKGSVRKPFADVIEWVNQQQAKIVAVDIPSGIDGTTGVMKNCAIRANVTVTFGCLKSGLLCNQGRELVGSVRVVDIGIPRMVSEDKRLQTFLVEKSDVRRILPKRSMHAHKYSVGKILVLAGSKGLTGAAALCCMSALRAGAGAVVLGTPEPIYPILARKLTETMVLPLPATSAGTLSLTALDTIREKFSWADILVIGPGLSLNSETQQLILKILLEYRGKILIDADGLNALAVHGISKLHSLRAQFILTPHVGEFSRLSNMSSKNIEEHRINAAREMAKRIGVVIVLKGVPTVVASKNGSAILNSTGNPGMATAGTGDVLSGIIAGLWAQGMSDAEAAWAGVYLHGLSGDIVAKKIGERCLVANDIIEYLSAALQSVEVGGTT